ncbi:MAG: LuxR C-terminal-related transcriptional regulator [Burkholderiaceae bacterium]
MKRSDPAPAVLPDVDALARLIDSLGQPGFGPALLEAFGPLLRCQHLSGFVFADTLQPRQILAQSLGGQDLAAQAGREYRAAALYLDDPNTRLVSAGDARDDQVLLLRLRASDAGARHFAQALYQRHGLADRVSVLAIADARWFVLSFYRDIAFGEFDERTLQLLRANGRLLVALMKRHLQGLPAVTDPPAPGQRPAPAMFEALLERVAPSLSERERQACARALRGTTNAGIALDLGIQVSTVATLRRRAFAKAGISSLNELFAMCLAAPANGPPGAPAAPPPAPD